MTKECVVCGREFEAEASRKCCSPECAKARIKLMRKKARNRRKSEKPEVKTMTIKICPLCGMSFEVSSSGRGFMRRKFCPKCSCEKERLLKSSYYYRSKSIRASGRVYTNTPERLAEIKAKYSRGIPEGEIEAWLS